MSVIKTERNFVLAYEPLPEDSFVHTFVIGSEERHLLLTQTIDKYQEAVDFAVSMADQMEMYIEVVPVTGAEYIQRNRERFERGLAAMTPSERHELRKMIVADMARIMRDCDDPTVRAGAYEVLTKLRAVQPPETD